MTSGTEEAEDPPASPAARPRPRFRTVEVSEPTLELDGLRMVTVRSPALGRRGDLTVYAEPADGGHPVPAVILLHGVFGSHWGWALKGGAHHTLRRLVAAGEVEPMVLIMPSDGLFGCGSAYVNRPGENAEAWIVDEVVAAARLAVPGAGDAGVCIAGLSMGGYGALRLAGLYPDRFVAAAGLSSITRLDEMGIFVAEPVDVTYPVAAAERNVADVLIAAAAAGSLPAIHIDCGRDDLLIEGNRILDGALLDAGIDHEYQEFDGGHEWPYWAKHLEDVLRFFDRALKSK